MTDYDPEAERAKLLATSGMNEIHRAPSVREIQAAALIDIAASLRVLATESTAYLDSVEPQYATAESPCAEAHFWAEGDRVFATAIGDGERGTILEIGVREDTVAARVEWDDGTETWAWLTELEPAPRNPDAGRGLVGSIGIDETLAALNAEADGEPDLPLEPETVVDDIDADFDGDQHPAAADALEALKAREKAAKKGGKK